MRPAVALFAVVLGLLPLMGAAAPVLTPPDAGIDGLMQAYDGQVPGAAVLVLHDGQPVFRRGYGLAVLEDGTTITAASNFRLASVSKQFTAAAVLLLVRMAGLGSTSRPGSGCPSCRRLQRPSRSASCSRTPVACSTTKT